MDVKFVAALLDDQRAAQKVGGLVETSRSLSASARLSSVSGLLGASSSALR